ncbi:MULTISPECIES: MATE family efflux transporter [unclassified Exiguobacterium]|uniref:MATE family efflux transporter n=1 Tax=unclassified Exiguobacterium TaxID=2644629 RepID=UPI00103F1D3C|nr:MULTISPECIES: MATE family efflux transporter [unclassified Exiguobacterium]TCI37717.1 MATE family efflux transporter [Exiguobacterium sp. SH4S7]TCI43246.1 MATE family efflux transporter [Exiguobacterium sp. SH5S32]TCI49967.1 MATE family efflux transporter [Exiguobacterium sp. SH1S4]TCI68368.1 MATE family efflux transporter [Exiguobacterium sp. SH1S1]
MPTKDTEQLSLFKISWPIFIELALHMGTGIIATLMLAQYSDAAASAVGVANQLLNVFLIVFSVTSVGATILIGQAIGAGRMKKSRDFARSAVSLNMWLGVVMVVVVFLFGETFLRLFGLSDELFDYGLLFLQIVGLSLFTEALIMALSAVLRSHGMTKHAMLATLLIDVITAAGAMLAVTGWFGLPVTGVAGVAWAIVIARLSAMVLLFWIVKRRLMMRFPIKELIRPKRDDIKALLQIGVPSAGENLSYQFSQIVITGFIATMGDASLAARVYVMNLSMLAFLFTVAIAQGTQLLIARDVGGKRFKEAYTRAVRTLKIAMFSSLVASLGLAVFGKSLLGLFTSNPDIIAVGIPILWATLILEPGRAMNIVLMGSLKSVGDVRFPVMIGIASMWGVAVVFSYLFGIQMGLGVLGIWLAFSLDEWFRGFFAFRRWKYGKWQQKGFQFEAKPSS